MHGQVWLPSKEPLSRRGAFKGCLKVLYVSETRGVKRFGSPDDIMTDVTHLLKGLMSMYDRSGGVPRTNDQQIFLISFRTRLKEWAIYVEMQSMSTSEMS
jgi:hypothetical protein